MIFKTAILVVIQVLMCAGASADNSAKSAHDNVLQEQVEQARLLRQINEYEDLYRPKEVSQPSSTRPATPLMESSGTGLPVWTYSPFSLPELRVPIKAYILANDDGDNRCPITPEEITLWVNEANMLFAGGNIRFDFDPSPDSGDWENHDSTLLNTMYSPGPEQQVAGNALAELNPGALTVLFRWGPNEKSNGRAFSWTNFDFVVMGHFTTLACGAQNIGLLAHEIGHQLALPHPFGYRFESHAEAESHFIENGSDPLLYEADGRGETGPDPYIRDYQCDGLTSVTLDTYSFDIPVGNVMSYYIPDTHFGPSQFAALRQGLQMRTGGRLAEVVTSGTAVEIEGELLDPVTDGGWTTGQVMTDFLGRWSNDEQLLWMDGAPGQSLTFSFTAPETRLYRVFAGFTAARDYGSFVHTINDQNGGEIDLYSTIVLPTGAVYIGTFALSEGSNTWRAEVTGANINANGSNHGYGLDYILLVPAPPFEINAGLNDAWFNPPTAGQGFLLTVFPDIEKLFAAWFTFDSERPPDDVEASLGEPGHRWFTALGPYDGDTAYLDIYLTEGGVFDAADPPAHDDGIPDGTMTIEFTTCTEGLVTYELFSPAMSGEIPIQRIADDNVALCEALSEH